MHIKILFMIIGGILTALFLRCVTTLHSYSGEHKPPMFGDYEAQRHWMEITYHLPMKEWYVNTTSNDLMYWGLDYPPLTAYHSWLCGLIANRINSEFVALNKSRGYESAEHKVFMRYTVLFADVLIYLPALCYYFYGIYKSEKGNKKQDVKRKSALKKPNKTQLEEYGPVDINQNANQVRKLNDKKGKNVTFSNTVYMERDFRKTSNNKLFQSFLLGLLYPGIILIDHGHFQYNCISLGLTVIAVNLLLTKQIKSAAVCFILALNYKQMQLYHALPFFFYYLNLFLVKSNKAVYIRFYQVFQISLIVIFTFFIVWYPFLFDLKLILQVIRRIFPIGRGVFEDKVANFWCTLNLFIKLKTKLDHLQMAKICLITTLCSISPSCIDLFLRANKQKFLLALINCSLGFYLFSFHVHEKTILIPALSVILYFYYDPFICFWFLYISCFSMVPLFIKDGLLAAYLSLTTFYLVTYRILTKKEYSRTLTNTKFGRNQFIRELLITLLNVNDGDKDYTDIVTLSFRHLIRNIKLVQKFLLKTTFMLSYLMSMILVFTISIFEPPDELPDIFPLLISVYSFLHFMAFFIYFNYRQLYQRDTDQMSVKNVKLKKM